MLSLSDFIESLKIKCAEEGVITDYEPEEYLCRLASFIEANDRVIVKKFRIGGFTTYLMLYALWQAFWENKRCIILAKNVREAKRLYELLDNIIASSGSDLKHTTNKTYLRMEFGTGSIKFMTPLQCRGHGADLVIIDEAAWIKMEKFWAALYPITITSKIVVVSTTNGIDNWFCDKWLEAEVAEINEETRKRDPSIELISSFFKCFHVTYEECAYWRNADNLAKYKASVTDEMFRQEILGKFVHNPTNKTKFISGISLTKDRLIVDFSRFYGEDRKKFVRELSYVLKGMFPE